MFQKELLARLKDTGLTIGQPKILDYLKDHDGAGQKDIAHHTPEPHGGYRSCRTAHTERQPTQPLCISD